MKLILDANMPLIFLRPRLIAAALVFFRHPSQIQIGTVTFEGQPVGDSKRAPRGKA